MIFADIREPQNMIDLYREIAQKIEQEITIKPLDVSDICVENKIGIERKTPSDFIASIKDDRLFKQAIELKMNFETPIILIEGNLFTLFQKNIAGQMNPGAIMGAISSLIVKYGVNVLFVPNNLKWVLSTLLKKATEADTHLEEYTPLRNKPKSNDFALNVLMSFPHVGQKTATRILEEYKTLENALKNHEKWFKNQRYKEEIKTIMKTHYQDNFQEKIIRFT